MVKNMRYLSSDEEKQDTFFINEGVIVALDSTCNRSRCGSVIVKDGEVIGGGFNSPPNEDESQRRCSVKKDAYHQKVTDKTCCVHAEQRAVMDALQKNPSKLTGSRLYFIRLDEEGNKKRSDMPYCTICSKMALDAGVAEFVLWHEDGVCVYDTNEYNDISFKYMDK